MPDLSRGRRVTGVPTAEASTLREAYVMKLENQKALMTGGSRPHGHWL
jgi:hypothetical protein